MTTLRRQEHPRGSEHAQASLETAIAILGAVLLFVGSVQIFLWIRDRLVRRQLDYEHDRVVAASRQPGTWNNRASKIPLRIFRPYWNGDGDTGGGSDHH